MRKRQRKRQAGVYRPWRNELKDYNDDWGKGIVYNSDIDETYKSLRTEGILNEQQSKYEEQEKAKKVVGGS